ncbi:MAG: hypothetical protein AAF481_12690 [Acidobacteriota bacterium]
MKFPENARRSARRLSSGAERFLDRVERRPELLRRRSFTEVMRAVTEVIPTFVGYAPDAPIPLQPWPVLISPAVRDDIARAVEGLARIVRTLPERFFDNDPKAIAAFYGLDSELLAALLVAEPTGIAESICRADLIDTPDGLRCVELNFGNASGWQDTAVSDAFLTRPPLSDALAECGLRVSWKDSAQALVEEAVRTCAGDDSADVPLNLVVVAATGGLFSFDNHPFARYERQFAEALAVHGHGRPGSIRLAGTDELEFEKGALFVRGDRMAGVIEQLNEVSRSDLFRAFKGGHLRLFTGPIGPLILGDKRNLALLSERVAEFEPEERAIIDRYVPWTRLMKSGSVTFRGRQVPLEGLLAAEREALVVKAAIEVGGKGVVVGRDASDDEWRQAVEMGLSEDGWLVQEFLDTPSFPFQTGEEGWAEHRLVWGPFVFGDDYGGLFVRMLPTDRGRVVNLGQGGEIGLAFVVDEAGD